MFQEEEGGEEAQEVTHISEEELLEETDIMESGKIKTHFAKIATASEEMVDHLDMENNQLYGDI